MQAKDFAAKAVGTVFLAVFFTASLGSLFLLMLPGDVNSLESRVNLEWTEKLAGLADLAFPELKDVTLDDVKFGCAIRGGLAIFGAQDLIGDLPVSDEDLDFICDRAGKVASIAELKEEYVSLKFGTVSADVFSRVRAGYVAPYTSTYMPVFIFASVVSLALACIFTLLGEGSAGRAARTLLLCACICSAALAAILVICWLAAPSAVENSVRQNPEVVSGLSQVPEEYAQFAEIAVSDAARAVSEWARGIIARFALLYFAAALVSGAGWAALFALSSFRGEKEESEDESGTAERKSR